MNPGWKFVDYLQRVCGGWSYSSEVLTSISAISEKCSRALLKRPRWTLDDNPLRLRTQHLPPSIFFFSPLLQYHSYGRERQAALLSWLDAATDGSKGAIEWGRVAAVMASSFSFPPRVNKTLSSSALPTLTPNHPSSLGLVCGRELRRSLSFPLSLPGPSSESTMR